MGKDKKPFSESKNMVRDEDSSHRTKDIDYRLLFQVSAVAITLSSVETAKYYDVNDVFLSVTGYTKDEVIGHTSEELGLYFNIADRTTLTDTVLSAGSINGLEVKARMKSGLLKDCLVSSVQIMVAGHPYFLSTIVDISDRKMAEDKEREAMSHQALISEVSARLVSLGNKEDVYKYIGEKVYSIVGDAYVFVSAYDPIDKTVQIKHLYGFSKFFETIRKNWGINPFEVKVPIAEMTAEELGLFKCRALVPMNQDPLYRLSGRRVNKQVCMAVEKLMGIKTCYTMGFSWEDRLYGGVGIACRNDEVFPQHKLIETIINLASVAIQRLYAEEKLRIEHENVNAVIAASPVGMLVLNSDQVIVEANPAAVKILGTELGELKNRFCGDFLDCQNRLEDPRGCGYSSSCRQCPIMVAIQNALGNNKGCGEQDTEVILGSGKGNLWLRFSIEPLILNNKRHAVLALQDITTQKKDELSLIKSERDYRNLFEQANDAIIIFDPDTEEVLDVNERACKIYGYPRQEFLGLRLKDISENIEKGERQLKKLVTENALVEFETIQYGKDGRKLYFLINSSMIDYHGKRLVLSINRDITERRLQESIIKETEEKYRLIAEKTTDVIWLMDLEGRSTFVTRSIQQFTGYTADEYLKQTIDDRFTKASAEYGKGIFGREIMSFRTNPEIRKNYFFVMVLEYVCKNGSTKWGELMVTPYFSAKGELVGIHGVTRDISERRENEKEIRRLNASLEQRVKERTLQLEATNKELESFSYSVSHDLKAPLRAIDGFSLMLLDDYKDRLDEEGKQYLETIRSSTQKMAQLINDLLTFSQLGRSNVKWTEADMESLVRLVYKENTSAEDKKKIKIIVGNLPKINADATMIHQVWVNLISNAIKFSSKVATPKLEIGSIKQNDEVIYFVKDNGAGFDMKYYDKLFGVFQRLHSSIDYPGTGVGLALVHRIVQKHGGRVWAESKENDGAIFYFSIPVRNGERSIV